MLGNINIAVGIPTNWDFLPIKFFQGFVGMDLPRHSVIVGNRGRIDDLRNSIIHKVLEDGSFTHILFLDTDHYFPPSTVKKLISHNKKIVSGLSFRRCFPYDPVIFKYDQFEMVYNNIEDWNVNKLIEVDAVGGACLLVDVEVFERMGTEKWFEFHVNEHGGMTSEDIYFCKKAKGVGYKIYCDTSCENKHLGSLEIDYETWKFFKEKN